MPIEFRHRLLSDNQPPRRRQVLDGSTKTVFEGPDHGTFVLYFKDDGVSPSDNLYTIDGKGAINNRISEVIMSRLDDLGINTHFIRRLNMREQLVRAADVYPFTVTMHNLAVGHFATRLGLDEGLLLPRPLVEFHLKSKTLQNPVISESHILTLGWASKDEIEEICEVSQRVNDFLCGQFLALGIRMANCTLEFGRVYLTEALDESHIILVDEISPETCHLVDITSGMRLDRSCHEKENSNPSEIYQEVAKRLGILSAGGPPDLKETTLLTHSD